MVRTIAADVLEQKIEKAQDKFKKFKEIYDEEARKR